jgi:hypothetical protein
VSRGTASLEMARIGALIASAQKGFKETVLERICASLSTLDDGFGGSSLASRSPPSATDPRASSATASQAIEHFRLQRYRTPVQS